MSLADELGDWALGLQVTEADLALADRSLLDTVAVAVAARREPVIRAALGVSEAARWATAAHVLDFDDLHMESTTHISAVCVPAALAAGGNGRAYLAGAGVMARLGTALGWAHYTAGWHATTTAGAPAAAVAAGIGLGLDRRQLATALALAIPAAGGVQRAFGTDAKSLQVGFAADAGVRAARLAAAGVTADPTALGSWLELMGGNPAALDLGGPAVPGGLAIKIYPCCYALQRPIGAIVRLHGEGIEPAEVRRVVVRTPKGTVTPLIHHDPQTGLQGKFSLEYAVAAALLDGYPGLASFTDEAVGRPGVRDLARRVEVHLEDGGDWLLAGEFEAEIHVADRVLRTGLDFPPGSPDRPATSDELEHKVQDCLQGTGLDAGAISWVTAGRVLRDQL